MMLINIGNMLKNAIYEENVEILEGILISSDSRFNLLEDFSKEEDLNLLIKILPKFKSKGLIRDIDNHCNMIKERLSSRKKIFVNSEPSVTKYVHYDNKKKNNMQYSNEDTFFKTRIK